MFVHPVEAHNSKSPMPLWLFECSLEGGYGRATGGWAGNQRFGQIDLQTSNYAEISSNTSTSQRGKTVCLYTEGTEGKELHGSWEWEAEQRTFSLSVSDYIRDYVLTVCTTPRDSGTKPENGFATGPARHCQRLPGNYCAGRHGNCVLSNNSTLAWLFIFMYLSCVMETS